MYGNDLSPDRQADRQTGRQTDRQTDVKTDKQLQGQQKRSDKCIGGWRRRDEEANTETDA
eukprot:scaffold197863_cov22-Prasinocladus_malaysianus.AAC.1